MDSKSTKKLDIGLMGEKVVAHWLEGEGWNILVQRWHCRWGEIDLIAKTPQRTASDSEMLVFIEVKARSLNNWDLNGLLSITPRKQAKLLQSAELFLSENAALSDLPCRFDVALVQVEKGHSMKGNSIHPKPMNVNSAMNCESAPIISFGQYSFRVCEYIQSAFC